MNDGGNWRVGSGRGLAALVDRIVGELANERANARLAVERLPALHKLRRDQAAARLQRLYDDYQYDWQKANGFTVLGASRAERDLQLWENKLRP